MNDTNQIPIIATAPIAATEPTTEQILASKDAEIARLKAELEEVRDAATWIICDSGTMLSEVSMGFLNKLRGDSSNAYDNLRAENATLRAELDAAKADSARVDWQPIETAPKDGAEFIGWSQSVGIKTWYWDAQQFNKKPRPFFMCVGSWRSTSSRVNQPTHWMPLPKAPAIADAM